MIWILLGIGLALVIFNLRAINKDKGSFKNVFNNTEEEMKEFDFKLSELRREFSETILELQKEIVKIKESYLGERIEIDNNIIEKTEAIEEIKVENNSEIINNDKEYKINNDKEYISEILDDKNPNEMLEVEENNQSDEKNNNIKVNEINRLLALGLSIEEISEKLEIGRGEVLLIKELYLR